MRNIISQPKSLVSGFLLEPSPLPSEMTSDDKNDIEFFYTWAEAQFSLFSIWFFWTFVVSGQLDFQKRRTA